MYVCCVWQDVNVAKLCVCACTHMCMCVHTHKPTHRHGATDHIHGHIHTQPGHLGHTHTTPRHLASHIQNPNMWNTHGQMWTHSRMHNLGISDHMHMEPMCLTHTDTEPWGPGHTHTHVHIHTHRATVASPAPRCGSAANTAAPAHPGPNTHRPAAAEPMLLVSSAPSPPSHLQLLLGVEVPQTPQPPHIMGRGLARTSCTQCAQRPAPTPTHPGVHNMDTQSQLGHTHAHNPSWACAMYTTHMRNSKQSYTHACAHTHNLGVWDTCTHAHTHTPRAQTKPAGLDSPLPATGGLLGARGGWQGGWTWVFSHPALGPGLPPLQEMPPYGKGQPRGHELCSAARLTRDVSAPACATEGGGREDVEQGLQVGSDRHLQDWDWGGGQVPQMP